MNIILVGHGRTGTAMKEATEMIFGEMTGFFPIEFLPGEGYESLAEKLRSLIHSHDMAPDRTIILTDLFSGSPYNAAATLALQGEAADVIAGMSLPICLTLAQHAADDDSSPAVSEVAEQAPTFTRILSAETRTHEEEEDFS